MTPGKKHAIGLVAVLVVAVASHFATGPSLIARLKAQSRAALDAHGGRDVTADFTSLAGLYTRHARLSTDQRLGEERRMELAQAVARIHGMGAVTWVRAPGLEEDRALQARFPPDHCQKDVEGLLSVRTIRFAEGSAAIDPASLPLVREVAEALRPCSGSRILVSGHTDPVGNEDANLRLSQQRAEAVRSELVRLGLSPRQIVARGFGSSRPLESTSPDDPANRRIEFEVLEVPPIKLTPIDRPAAQ
ncbi:OmpA family protein [Novosphingobium sp. ZN18A2]|uniref:OmpA family protein n=1 Tax=Novosphingobium sp. ZN18A2 TaxID=3079861 RepID=UPI0030D61F69